MPIDISTFGTKLNGALTSADTRLHLVDETDVRAELADGKVVFLQIYTAARSEIVVVYETDEGDLVMGRGKDGTTAQPWPCDACVCAIRVVDGPICECEEDEAASQTCDGPLTFKTEGCLSVAREGNEVTISLKKTGVVAGNYNGLVINECGLISSIAPGWPNAINYNPCPCG